MTSPQNWEFWTPLPPLSPFVTILVEPPPPYVTRPNSDKLFSRIIFGKRTEESVIKYMEYAFTMMINSHRTQIGIDWLWNLKVYSKIFWSIFLMWWRHHQSVPPSPLCHHLSPIRLTPLPPPPGDVIFEWPLTGLRIVLSRVEWNCIERTITSCINKTYIRFAAYQHAGPEWPAYTEGNLQQFPKIPNRFRSRVRPGKLSQRLLAVNQTHSTVSCGAPDRKLIRSTANYYN